MLSPEVQHRLQLARKNETRYHPDPDISAQLAEKVLIMGVGPAAIGKSLVMNHTTVLDSGFGRVPVVTTREPRPDDEPDMFRYVPHDDTHVSSILDQIDARELVEYVVHPTLGYIYGTEITDYPGKYNMLPTISGMVEHLRTLPFEKTYVIGFAAQPDAWNHWFDMRLPKENEERPKRLGEAVMSLTWLLAEERQSYVQWVENILDKPDGTAESIIRIVKHSQSGDERVRDIARRLLDHITRMIESETT